MNSSLFLDSNLRLGSLNFMKMEMHLVGVILCYFCEPRMVDKAEIVLHPISSKLTESAKYLTCGLRVCVSL